VDEALLRTYDDQVCPIARALEVVGERWSLLIVRDALLGLSRFEQFQDSLDIARNVAYAAIITVLYVYPADRAFGQRLYELPMRRLGWSDPHKPIIQITRDPRLLADALFMAHEFGDQLTEDRLRVTAEREFQPCTFGDERDRIGYWYKPGQPALVHPGQLNSLMMLSEIGQPGDWWRVFNQPNLAKHHQPTIEGVQYPALGIIQACYEPETAPLGAHLRRHALAPTLAHHLASHQPARPVIGDRHL